MDKTQKSKTAKRVKQQNVLEILRDLGSLQDFSDQILGNVSSDRKFSGDIQPGESLSFKDVLSGNKDKEVKLQKQLSFERNLRDEEKSLSNKKIEELRFQLQIIIREAQKTLTQIGRFTKEAEIALLQTPVEPGQYHLNFFEKILLTLIDFRKKIDSATIWLASVNKRANKKNYWAMYKEKKGSFLLAPDHYSQRSAG